MNSKLPTRKSICSAAMESVIVLLLTVSPILSRPHTYFVSPSGNNAYTGLEIHEPFKSINVAIRKAVAGDTICVLPGTYKELITFSDKKGIPENPIVLIGFSDQVDQYPVIDGGAVTPSSIASFDWMHIRNSEWLEIARLKFKNGWTFPIQVTRSSYLTFRQCQFRGGKRVINASGKSTHHILVEDCSWDQGGDALWKLVEDSAGVPAWTSMHHGAMAYFNGSLIDFSGTGGSMVIRRNTVVNAFQAVRYRGRKGCDSNVEIYENNVSNMRDNDFEPEYYTYNLHIYHNVSHNIHRTLSVDNVEGGNIYYYGNTVTADTDAWSLNICAGIWKVFGRPYYLSSPIYAFNNSFYAPGIAFQHMPGKAMYLRHWNNAYFFLKDGGWDLNEWDSTDEFDYDISNKPWSPRLEANHQEKHGMLADVLFVDPARGNLTLQTNSKGVDGGRIVSLKEFDWSQSFKGKGPDIGAFEGGDLVEGPPFRFMLDSGATVAYREKPRIVRHRIDGKTVSLYFSDRIDPSSVGKENLQLYVGDKRIGIVSVSLWKDKYRLSIEAGSVPASGEISIAWARWPKGLNGEIATSWASTIPIHQFRSE